MESASVPRHRRQKVEFQSSRRVFRTARWQAGGSGAGRLPELISLDRNGRAYLTYAALDCAVTANYSAVSNWFVDERARAWKVLGDTSRTNALEDRADFYSPGQYLLVTF